MYLIRNGVTTIVGSTLLEQEFIYTNHYGGIILIKINILKVALTLKVFFRKQKLNYVLINKKSHHVL